MSGNIERYLLPASNDVNPPVSETNKKWKRVDPPVSKKIVITKKNQQELERQVNKLLDVFSKKKCTNRVHTLQTFSSTPNND